MARADPHVARRSSSRGQILKSRADPQVTGSDRAARPLSRAVTACRRAPVAPDMRPVRAGRRSPPGLIIRRTDSPAADRRQNGNGRSTRKDAGRATAGDHPCRHHRKKRGVGTVCFDRSHPPVWGLYVGGDLLSHTLPGAVPSALEGLASGFGKGPGVSRSAITTDTTIHIFHAVHTVHIFHAVHTVHTFHAVRAVRAFRWWRSAHQGG
jgi:hypothetical protein